MGHNETMEMFETIARLEEENRTLKEQLAKPWEHSEHWRNPESGQIECECCCSWAMAANQTNDALTAATQEVERLREQCDSTRLMYLASEKEIDDTLDAIGHRDDDRSLDFIVKQKVAEVLAHRKRK